MSVADGSDDLLNPEDIEALLESAANQPGGGASQDGDSEAASEPQRESPDSAGDILDPAEIEALLQQQKQQNQAAAAGTGPGPTSAASSQQDASHQRTEQLLDEAEAGLAAAVAPEAGSPAGDFDAATPYAFRPFDNDADQPDERRSLQALEDVELDLRIELGRTTLLIDEVTRLKEGSVVPLDKLAGDPVDILVNGRLVARGEVLVLNDNFCVRVAEILTPDF